MNMFSLAWNVQQYGSPGEGYGLQDVQRELLLPGHQADNLLSYFFETLIFYNLYILQIYL